MSDILTPEEVRACAAVANCGDDSALSDEFCAVVNHAALLGARKALSGLVNAHKRIYGAFINYIFLPEIEAFRDRRYPLPRPAREPRKVVISGGRIVAYNPSDLHNEWRMTFATGTCVTAPSAANLIAVHGGFADADIAAIASLPDNPWEDSK